MVVSDLHLSHTPPLARSTEKDWYGCMQRVLEEIMEVRVKRSKTGKPVGIVDVVYPGDIFHTWNPPPELINLALESLPPGFSIPGQHDLPNHNYEDIKKSGYWTLVKAGRVEHLDAGDEFYQNRYSEDFVLYGFPWGKEITPPESKKSLNVAIVHAYCWRKGMGYPGAPQESRAKNWLKKLRGYDYAFFGDNHVPFQVQGRETLLTNCGSMMRRNIDQTDHRPKCWLLLGDGGVISHELDTSKDVLYDGRDTSDVIVGGKTLSKFIDRLKELQTVVLDFDEAVERYLKRQEVSDGVRKIILSALEESK